jgi:P27 family predicted phage terminase small subunit
VSAEKIPAPEHLSERTKTLWDRIVEENTIDSAAAEILRTLCDALDRREQARDAMKETGPLIKDRFGVLKVHPAAAIERDSTLIMHRAFRLLGFDQEPRGEQGKLF